MARQTADARGVIPRVIKFEIFPSEDQVRVLVATSQNLTRVWNEALAQRTSMFEEHIAPFYQELKGAGEDKAVVAGIRARLKQAFADHQITGFDQINALTARRKDSEFDSVTRNWQEQTLIMLHGAFSSFMTLRKKGDLDAKPTRHARREGEFYEIYGRSGFKVRTTGREVEWQEREGLVRRVPEQEVVLRPGKIAGDVGVVFSLPAYQSWVLAEAEKLGKFAVKQFTLYRDRRNLAEPGRFWLSLAFEWTKPETVPPRADNTVYLALGASSLGVISSQGEEVLKLWRPDKHWVPKIRAIEERMKACTKGSRKWEKLNDACRRMNQMMSRQQTQDIRELVDYLLEYHGVHFVVTELIVRSKDGKLADSSKPERGGTLGLNWAAQNTGGIGYLVLWLKGKVKERGGSVTTVKLKLDRLDGDSPPGDIAGNKLWLAKRLRESPLASTRT
ncbi:MAG TPA: hypothetical protein VJJ24_03190 [Candidatus Paceibacterota bacterium]